MTPAPPNVASQVSVIVPAYNTAHLIVACLDSVFTQTYRDFEVIVVNDGSPDTTELERVLQPYLSRIVYIRQENKRAAGARNTAIGKSCGEFLAFLDSDDSWFPNHLADQMKLFEANPGPDLVYANAFCGAEQKKTFMEKCPSEGPATFEALVVERCQIPISTVVARKAAVVKAGLFDEKLARCDDYDLWLRAALFGARIAYRKTVQARLDLGRPDSLSLSRANMTEAYWRILEKTAQTLSLNSDQRKLVEHRAEEIRGRFLLEQGKVQLRERHPEKARELFAEANSHLHRLKLSIAIRSLQLAPRSASRLIAAWGRFRNSGRREYRAS